MTTSTPALRFTTRAFVRSHGRQPSSSTSGSWAFQASLSDTAFDRELTGEVVWFQGTLSTAKRALRASGARGLWAVLP